MFLEMNRTLPVRPPVAFASFTDPEQLRQWWGPKGFTVPTLDFLARAGSDYRIEMRTP